MQKTKIYTMSFIQNGTNYRATKCILYMMRKTKKKQRKKNRNIKLFILLNFNKFYNKKYIDFESQICEIYLLIGGSCKISLKLFLPSNIYLIVSFIIKFLFLSYLIVQCELIFQKWF